MLVPSLMIKLNEANTALRQPPRQQAIRRERAVAALGSVEIQNVLRFVGQIHQSRHTGLHPESHLVLRNSRVRLRVADLVVAHAEGPAPQLAQRHDAGGRWRDADLRLDRTDFGEASPVVQVAPAPVVDDDLGATQLGEALLPAGNLGGQTRFEVGELVRFVDGQPGGLALEGLSLTR